MQPVIRAALVSTATPAREGVMETPSQLAAFRVCLPSGRWKEVCWRPGVRLNFLPAIRQPEAWQQNRAIRLANERLRGLKCRQSAATWRPTCALAKNSRDARLQPPEIFVAQTVLPALRRTSWLRSLRQVSCPCCHSSTASADPQQSATICSIFVCCSLSFFVSLTPVHPTRCRPRGFSRRGLRKFSELKYAFLMSHRDRRDLRQVKESAGVQCLGSNKFAET